MNSICHSEENMEFCKNQNIDHVLGAIQGKQSRYDLNYDDNGELIVTDRQTNIIIPTQSVKSETRKWKILTDDKKCRYFTEKDIEMCNLRRQIANRSPDELKIRNNVEATIFQLCYHFPNNKSKYRGIIKHRMWAFMRCIWINFVRIMNYLKSLVPKSAKKERKVIQIADSLLFFINMSILFLIHEKISSWIYRKNGKLAIKCQI